ncbi:hypothetical protein PHMEG_0002497 [Phytophthora megakarya]|uniref:Uncharacterized protein n=1 Tax=Phytophthora megakarya TaxID=4795 RepID=A0A225WY63_9STRA|nr:hypothetical protein PHMEG_0002497 [Phytophthora megakarya]
MLLATPTQNQQDELWKWNYLYVNDTVNDAVLVPMTTMMAETTTLTFQAEMTTTWTTADTPVVSMRATTRDPTLDNTAGVIHLHLSQHQSRHGPHGLTWHWKGVRVSGRGYWTDAELYYILENKLQGQAARWWVRLDQELHDRGCTWNRLISSLLCRCRDDTDFGIPLPDGM